ncbi:M48 family metalloprotease [Hahella ganghwensis]|uniref:M48 family metalloprotease n=1 Tax=Hahella ganghwensis TaxID=286420 RepID=UPI00037F4DAC|nr:M48 family metalloprotease [Hahella ganghwensis]
MTLRFLNFLISKISLRSLNRAIIFSLGLTLAHPAHSANEDGLPDLGNSSGSITPSQEQALGQAWLRSLRGQVQMLEDPLTIQYVKDLIFKLAPNSQLTDRSLTTIVVDSSALNAFAVPGGVIGVNGGLFLHAQTEQEFAGVLAHELAHLSQRHFARRLEESKSYTALNMAGILASVILAAAGGTDAGIAALASSQALSLQEQLSYSRQNEQEADRIGMETLINTGMDAQAMPAMFERMLKNSRYSSQVPEYLRTHPLTESRVADTANRAASSPPGNYQEDVDYYFVQSRILTHYAKNAEEALQVFNGRISNNTGIKRKAALYGAVLATIKVNRPKESKNALTQLLNTDANRISVVLLHADWLTATDQQDAAINLLKRHLERNPDNYPLSRALANLYNKQERYTKAEEILRRLTTHYGSEPDLWYQMAETHGLAGSIAELHQARAEYFYLKGDIGRATQQLRQALKKAEGNYQQTLIIKNRLKEVSAAGEGYKF